MLKNGGNLITRDRFYYGWIIVIIALVVGAALLGTRHSFGVFFNSMETEFGLNRAVTSAVFSVYMIFSGVISILAGWILDKKGPKFTVLLMGVFTGLSLLASSQVRDVWQLYLTYSLLLAIGTGETFSIIGAVVSRWFHKKRGLALGIANMGGGLGGIIFAPFATYLIISFDWRGAFIILGIITGVLTIVSSLFLKRSPGDLGLLPDGEKPGKTSPAPELPGAKAASGFTVKEALRTRPFWFIFLIWALLSTGVYLIINHMVPHALDVGISSMASATILSVLSGFYIPGSLLTGSISDRFGRRATAFTAALIGAGAFFWLMWMPNNLWFFYAFAALFGFSWGSLSTVVGAIIGDIFGTGNIGTIFGWIVVGFFVGGAVGPVVGGYLYDVTGSYFLAFLAGAIAMLLAALLALLLPRQNRVRHARMS